MRSMVKKIVLAAAVFVLAGVMIAANIVLAVNSTVIHSWFDKSTSSYDNNEQQAVITQGDELVRDIAEQSMVLLRNENDTLPLDKETQGKVNLFGWSSSDAGFLLVGGGSGGTTLDDDIAYTLQEALTQERRRIQSRAFAALRGFQRYERRREQHAEHADVRAEPGRVVL